MQRILLEVVYEATENAGIPMDTFAGSNTSCYVGCFTSDYDQLAKRDPETLPKYHSIGTGQAILSNRVSYCFDLKGPSLTLDTACSSSLVAIHLACQSLRTGESQTAVVGATHAILNPDVMVGMTNLHFLSADSICHTFDERANGYSRGEGMAALILKPLDAAVAAGDTIRAVIRGTSLNSNGRNHGITLPSREAQGQLIRTAYEQAGCDMSQTGYFEAHGTGTAAGDPIETGAIGDTLGACRPDGEESKLYIGSVKTNIGHLEGASGLAGLIKAVMSVEKGLIAPNLWFEKGNPKIEFDKWRIKVPTDVMEWPTSGLRRASINGFGYGGSNAHVIIDDAYHFMLERGIQGRHSTSVPEEVLQVTDAEWESSGSVSETPIDSDVESLSSKSSFASQPPSGPYHRAFFISAKESKLVGDSMKRLAEHVASDSTDDDSLMKSLAYTLSQKRSRFEYGATVVASSKDELMTRLLVDPDVVQTGETPSIGFIFTGQGAQWWAMGRELLQYPVFYQSIKACAAAVESCGAQWNLVEELLKDQATSRLNEAEISQPLCSAVQIALVDLYESWGISISRVVGHSSGEIAAAYATGALPLSSAMAAAYYRGVFSAKISTLGFKGSMLAAGLSEAEALAEIALIPESKGKVVVACVNSPRSVTISGDLTAILEIRKILTSKGIFARKLQVETAYHSHHMAALAQEYHDSLANMEVVPWTKRKPVTMFSSVKARAIDQSDDLSAAYWVANMVSCVRFSDALTDLCSDGQVNTLLELGPHSALAGPVKQTLAEMEGIKVHYLSALVRNQNAADSAVSAAATLFAKGYAVDMLKLNSIEASNVQTMVNLPTYPWNHEKTYWSESRLSRDYRFRSSARTDILGAPCMDWNPLEPRWRNFIRMSEQPWVRSHVVQGAIVYPAAGYCCMALEAAKHLEGMDQNRKIRAFKINGLSITRALVLPDTEEGVEVSFSMRRVEDKEDSHEFRVFSYTEENGWAQHCHGIISLEFDETDSTMIPATEDLVNVPHDELYAALDAAGLYYGPEFQGIHKISSTPGCANGIVKVTDTASGMLHGHEFARMVHPATMDTFLQMSIAALVGNDVARLRNPYVPTDIEEVTVSGTCSLPIGSEVTVTAVTEATGRNALGDVFASNGGNNFISMRGVKLVGIASADGQKQPTKHCATAVWEPEVDLLSKEQANELLRDAAEGTSGRQRLRDMELLAYYYFDRVLAEISEDEVPHMHPHHQKFFRYMKHQKTLVEAGTHEQQTADWLNFHDDQVQQRIQQQIQELANPNDYEGEMFVRMGEALTSVLRKEIDPLQLMLKDNLLYNYYTVSLGTKGTYPQIARYISMLSHKNPDLEYLEIGAGTGGCSLPVLEALSGTTHREYKRLKSYVYSDISAGFFEQAADKFSEWSDVIEFSKLDIEQDPSTQPGFETRKFDVIIAANVLHATFDMTRTMRHVRQLLKPDGKLVLLDMTHSVLCVSLVFGNLSGWWNCSEDWREYGPLLDESQWSDVLAQAGFSSLEVSSPDCLEKFEEQTRVMVASAVEPNPVKDASKVLLVTNDASDTQNISALVEQKFAGSGIAFDTCTLDSLKDASDAIVISIAELQTPVLMDIPEKQFQNFQTILQQAKGVVWITMGATEGDNPELALFQGLARSLRAEREDMSCISLDLSSRQKLPEADVATLIQDMYQELFFEDSVVDREFTERNGIVHIKRAVESARLDGYVDARTNGTQVTESRELAAVSVPLRVGDGYFDQVALADIALNDVQVSVKAVDMPSEGTGAFGFSGVVTAVGSNVHHFGLGDQVYGLNSGQFTTEIQCDSNMVQRMSSEMSFTTAASVPLAYAAAYFGLVTRANVASNQSVLIIDGANISRAAISICKALNASFCVVSERVEEVKEVFGLPDSQVFTTVEAAQTQTNGSGYEIVLDDSQTAISLTKILGPLGHYIKASPGTLSPDVLGAGRMVSNVDVFTILQSQPLLVSDILSRVSKLIGTISIPPLTDTHPFSMLVTENDRTSSVFESRNGDVAPVSYLYLTFFP